LARNRSWATIRLAMSSMIGPVTKTIRSLRSRLKMSYARSPRADCSTTMGTSVLALVLVIGLPCPLLSVSVRAGSGRRAARVQGHVLRGLAEHLVHQAVGLGLLGAEVLVPLGVQ